jgi:hypothetical protein
MAFSFGSTSFTPEEAQGIASELIGHFRRAKADVGVEEAVTVDAPYRTTLIVRHGQSTLLIEVQHAPSFGGSLREFARWLASERADCELYVATEEDAAVSGALLNDITRNGVGLMVVSQNGDVTLHKQARNPALVVTPAPVPLGQLRKIVDELVAKFNSGERKDALRELCELVEAKTDAVIRKAARSGYLTMSEARVAAMNWSNQIDTLASAAQYVAPHAPLVAEPLKIDLHSFRGARNLVDHRVRSKTEASVRERQYPERMMAGPRLLSELAKIDRTIR